MSHPPADARHEKPAARNVLAGHTVEAPVQFSTMSHPPPEVRQTVVFTAFATVAVQAPPALHVSFEEHTFPSSQTAAVAAV
jgi:hypothetical protein